MKNKLVFATGLAAGYVLGTRAGRGSYEQLKTKANELWNNPKVQESVSNATGTIKKKAPEVQQKATEGINKATDKVGNAAQNSKPGANKSDNKPGDKSANNKADGTGPSGGNPLEVEETPFQQQSEKTRPKLGD